MSSDAFEQQMAMLRAEYRHDLPATLLGVENLWRSLATGSVPPARLMELQRQLHSIAGSAKTFGLAQLTESARAAEDFLEPYCAAGALPGVTEQAHLERLLHALKRAAP